MEEKINENLRDIKFTLDILLLLGVAISAFLLYKFSLMIWVILNLVFVVYAIKTYQET